MKMTQVDMRENENVKSNSGFCGSVWSWQKKAIDLSYNLCPITQPFFLRCYVITKEFSR